MWKYKCIICSKEFKRYDQWMQHCTERHSEKISVTSEKQQKVISITGKLHSENDAYEGSVRQHDYSDKFALTADRHYICFVCGARFPSALSHKNHSREHIKKSFVSNKCGEGFGQSKYLKLNSKVHSMEKPFICVDCGKGFRCSITLKTHSRVHRQERPYVCDDCGKGFKHNHHLKDHSTVHSKLKPYVCDICGKAFAQSRGLRRHNKLHTPKKVTKM